MGVRLAFPLPRDYTTVAGLVLAGLGRLPAGPGESVRLPGLTVEVVEVADRAVRRVRLRGPAAGNPSGYPDGLPAAKTAVPGRNPPYRAEREGPRNADVPGGARRTGGDLLRRHRAQRR
ncbi:transporter associated domain-containing protein [Micromonospora purpureochromogenes]|uniref:transporter associated domain-containing protein n=1 Tax=Micromonospora purpureochromogenes TaxID=47872 RepID=UPI003D9DE866